MLKLSTTSIIECKVPPENVLLYEISDTLLKKHVIVENRWVQRSLEA